MFCLFHVVSFSMLSVEEKPAGHDLCNCAESQVNGKPAPVTATTGLAPGL